MRSKLTRTSLVLLSIGSLGLLGASCQTGTTDQAKRLEKIESSLTQMSGVVSRVKTLEGKEGGMASQLAGVQTSLTELQNEVAEFDRTVQATQGASQDLKKKADELGGRVSSLAGRVDSLHGKIAPLEQKLSLLQTRYEDHLRKYHSGG